ncbi:putative acetyltransferase, partial [Streptomyces sparsus]
MEFIMSGRLEVRLTPEDVGKRVSVRSLTGSSESGARLTDTLGVLTSWDEGVLRVTRRDGEVVTLERSAVVAGKVVPPAPARRRGLPAADVTELIRVADRGWPATER